MIGLHNPYVTLPLHAFCGDRRTRWRSRFPSKRWTRPWGPLVWTPTPSTSHPSTPRLQTRVDQGPVQLSFLRQPPHVLCHSSKVCQYVQSRGWSHQPPHGRRSCIATSSSLVLCRPFSSFFPYTYFSFRKLHKSTGYTFCAFFHSRPLLSSLVPSLSVADGSLCGADVWPACHPQACTSSPGACTRARIRTPGRR